MKAAARPIPDVTPLPPDLDTPCLILDLDRAEANARRMGAAAAERGVALRPHVKTHKSVALARMQLDAGARGITVGTLGEAEVMAAGGIDDIFIAYPVWADGLKADRLRSLHARTPLVVGVDSVAGAELPGGGRRRPFDAAAGAGRDGLGRASHGCRRCRCRARGRAWSA